MGKNLKEILKEHQYAVRIGYINNGLNAHAWKFKHTINWSSTKVKMYDVNI